MKYEQRHKRVFLGENDKGEAWLEVTNTVIKGCPGDRITPGTPDELEIADVVLCIGDREWNITDFTDALHMELKAERLTQQYND